uniref:RNA exonuclease 1 homolog-like domain-containing protein n=1 Tax=Pipistrellus kuhlii TaxID=59472 RepID=A0A7J7YML2_PIPKU|nr:hypothetical protein mPipKuh1_010141 [Pipistrellus kuhlii]
MRASCPGPIPVPLHPCHHPTRPGCLPHLPPRDSWAPKFLLIQPEAVRRGLVPRTPLPPAQELCDPGLKAKKPPRYSVSRPRAAQLPTPKLSFLHISASGGDRRRVALVPKPCLAAGAKRPLPASSSSSGSSPPAKAQGLGSQLPETCAPSDQPSLAPSTLPRKPKARGPPLQSPHQPVPAEEGGDKVTLQRSLSLFLDQCPQFCPSTQEAPEKALQEEKAAFHQSPRKRKYCQRAATTCHRLRGLGPSPRPGPCKTFWP